MSNAPSTRRWDLRSRISFIRVKKKSNMIKTMCFTSLPDHSNTLGGEVSTLSTSQGKIKLHRQTDRDTDRQAEKQAGRHTDRQRYRQTYRQTGRQRQTDKCIGRQTDKKTERQTQTG